MQIEMMMEYMNLDGDVSTYILYGDELEASVLFGNEVDVFYEVPQTIIKGSSDDER